MSNSYFISGGKNFYKDNTVVSNDNAPEASLTDRLKHTKNITSVITRTGKIVTEDSFTIIDAGTDFPISTHLFATATNEETTRKTELALTLKLNSSSISSLVGAKIKDTFTPSTLYIALTVFDDFIVGRQDTGLNYSSFGNDGHINTVGLISCTVSSHVLSSPTIIQAGKFLTSMGDKILYDFNCDSSPDKVNTLVPYDPSIVRPNPDSDDAYIVPVEDFNPNTSFSFGNNLGYVSCKVLLAPVTSIELEYDDDGFIGGNSIPVGSTVKLKRTFSDLDATLSPGSDAVLSCTYKLNAGTVIISGGSNYVVGDTFTSDDGSATTVGTHTVISVDKNGSILESRLTNPGVGFTSEPTVTYNGSTGSGASITVSEINYSVSSVTVTSGGNGYSISDKLGFYNSLGEEIYVTTPKATIIVESALEDDLKLNNTMSLEGITVVDGGENHSGVPTLQFVDLKTGENIANTSSFVTANADNFEEAYVTAVDEFGNSENTLMTGQFELNNTKVNRSHYYPKG